MAAILAAFAAASAAQWQQYVTPGTEGESLFSVAGCSAYPGGAAVPVTQAECTDATEAVYNTVPFPFVNAAGNPFGNAWTVYGYFRGGYTSSWNDIPAGCSYSTQTSRALWNTNTGGVGDDDEYFFICKLPLPPSPRRSSA